MEVFHLTMNYFSKQEPTKQESKSKPKPSKPQKWKPIRYDQKDKNKTVGQILDDLENDKFVCYYCDKIFKSQPFLQDHRKRHFDENGYLPCRLCDKYLPNYTKLCQHINAKHKPMNCKDCDKTFVNSASLSRFSFAPCFFNSFLNGKYLANQIFKNTSTFTLCIQIVE